MYIHCELKHDHENENNKIHVERSIRTYNYTILNAILFVCADVAKHEECTMLEVTP